MDLDEFREVLSNAGMDVWTFIDTAIAVASVDYGDELKNHRDRIVERLYAASAAGCRNCGGDGRRIDGRDANSGRDVKAASPCTPQSEGDDEDRQDRDRDLEQSVDDEQARILAIKEHLEDPDQSEDSLVELLQSLADMDITFKALKETDIGRHVNRLRKNPSNDVRRLVKQLVRKWKDLVDEWVKLNTPGELAASALIAEDSPPQRLSQNGYHQVPDFAYSPNPHNGSSGSDRNSADPEPKSKAIPRREAPTKPPHTVPVPASKQRERDDIDLERLASARKRLHQNYKEAQNAKKQRTIQVMDIHEIPKPKNSFFAKNKGGFHGRH